MLLPGLIANVRSVLPDAQLLIVDDKSVDTSIEILQAHEVHHCINAGARGFAATVNCGLRWLTEHSPATQYVLVANSDIQFQTVFAEQLHALGARLAALEPPGVVGFEEVPEPQAVADPAEVRLEQTEYVSGFLFVLPVGTIRRIGYLAEGYFMYGEELDYFARARRNGLAIYRTNIAVVHRRESSGRRFENTWLAHRNAMRFAVKCLSPGAVGRTTASFMLAPIRFTPAQIAQSPSLSRTLRYGALVSMGLLFAALAWNIIMLPQTLWERLREDRHIRKLAHGQDSTVSR
jgi:GT2 family glycosyltransferase